MIILALASIWSWTVAFDKIFKFIILKIKIKNFERIFDSKKSADEIVKLSKKKSTNPFSQILLIIAEELQLSNIEIGSNQSNDKKISYLRKRMEDSAQITIEELTFKLEKGMNFLAITGSVAPFIGLFGTVWGIMNSFQSIAISKNTSLAVVAPGIAEALLATAIGLFAAIPAVFFYNVYNNKLNNFIDQMHNFSIKAINSLLRNLEK